MTRIVVSEFLTPDGVMEASESWQPSYVTEDVAQEIMSHINAADGSLYGRVTYQMFASYWPTQTHNEFGIADKLNHEPKWVVSTSLQKADWGNSMLIRGNVADEIRRLKRQPGGYIRLVGSATLAQSLMQAGLIDEYWLLVHPLVLAHGKKLFADGIGNTPLKLVEAKPFGSGVVLLRYQPERTA